MVLPPGLGKAACGCGAARAHGCGQGGPGLLGILAVSFGGSWEICWSFTCKGESCATTERVRRKTKETYRKGKYILFSVFFLFLTLVVRTVLCLEHLDVTQVFGSFKGCKLGLLQNPSFNL